MTKKKPKHNLPKTIDGEIVGYYTLTAVGTKRVRHTVE